MSYEERIIEVPGTNKGKIFIFTLSTCIWCKKTKALLKELGVNYSYIDVDLVVDNSKHDLMVDFQKYSDSVSFPTIVVNDGEEVINGFDEDRLRELFSK
jgi:glutaredoxin